ncbi:hypothetical protein DHC50_08240 [Arenibacter sp. A80]|nr:hypothetical protein [Arenibacter sp. A80]RFT56316.1 hypothetical protein D0S24_08235 [Arenibacter sp. P308M17]
MILPRHFYPDIGRIKNKSCVYTKIVVNLERNNSTFILIQDLQGNFLFSFLALSTKNQPRECKVPFNFFNSGPLNRNVLVFVPFLILQTFSSVYVDYTLIP